MQICQLASSVRQVLGCASNFLPHFKLKIVNCLTDFILSLAEIVVMRLTFLVLVLRLLELQSSNHCKFSFVIFVKAQLSMFFKYGNRMSFLNFVTVKYLVFSIEHFHRLYSHEIIKAKGTDDSKAFLHFSQNTFLKYSQQERTW